MSQDLVVTALNALRNRDFVAARNSISAFAEDNPLELQHYLIRGLSDIALKDWEAASDTFHEATVTFPHQPQLWYNLGIAQENLGLLDDATASYEYSLDLNPEQAEACGNLSNIYRRLGFFSDAESMAHRAYELGASKPGALNCLGLALARQGKLSEAEKVFRQILELEPNNSHALVNLANCEVDRLEFSAAWPLYAAARAADNNPVIRHDEALARLLAGDYVTGWPLYEARMEQASAVRIRPTMPMWRRGTILTGKKLLLVAEQGFGDMIQFCRYGAVLAAQDVTLIWVMPTPLVRLMADNLPGTVVAEGDPLPEADYWMPVMSLPYATERLSPADTMPTPYLRIAATPELPGGKKDKRKIGIVWTASPTNERGYEKSMPIETLAPLWNLEDTQFYAPFINPRLSEIKQQPIRRLDNLIKDFTDTAGLLMQLDCLVTVDTATAHLAGALGLKAFVLLPYCPDWRWGTDGMATPFYPTLTLLRQPKPGDWESVITELVKHLD